MLCAFQAGIQDYKFLGGGAEILGGRYGSRYMSPFPPDMGSGTAVSFTIDVLLAFALKMWILACSTLKLLYNLNFLPRDAL